jgi:hypothetical protein
MQLTAIHVLQLQPDDFVRIRILRTNVNSDFESLCASPYIAILIGKEHPRHPPQQSQPSLSVPSRAAADCAVGGLTRVPRAPSKLHRIHVLLLISFFFLLCVLASASISTCYRFVAIANRVFTPGTCIQVVGFVAHSTLAASSQRLCNNRCSVAPLPARRQRRNPNSANSQLKVAPALRLDC